MQISVHFPESAARLTFQVTVFGNERLSSIFDQLEGSPEFGSLDKDGGYHLYRASESSGFSPEGLPLPMESSFGESGIVNGSRLIAQFISHRKTRLELQRASNVLPSPPLLKPEEYKGGKLLFQHPTSPHNNSASSSLGPPSSATPWMTGEGGALGTTTTAASGATEHRVVTGTGKSVTSWPWSEGQTPYFPASSIRLPPAATTSAEYIEYTASSGVPLPPKRSLAPPKPQPKAVFKAPEKGEEEHPSVAAFKAHLQASLVSSKRAYLLSRG